MNEIKNLPHSIHDRLRNLALQENRPLEWFLRVYAMERFLYRLSKSKYRDKFVLKGGLMFMGWEIPLRRFTRDIDFRGFINNEITNVTQIIKEICLQEVEPDGIEFNIESITTEVITEAADYPGIRVNFSGHLGERTTIPMQIDIGFSDEITPKPVPLSFPALLDMPVPELIGYPKETFVAEKLECIIYRGILNSRLKDYYDLWMIIQYFDFDGKTLQEAIQKTFFNRKTELPSGIPPGLSEAYATERQREWVGFLKGFSPGIQEIEDFQHVISGINLFILPVLQAINKNMTFEKCWNPKHVGWIIADESTIV